MWGGLETRPLPWCGVCEVCRQQATLPSGPSYVCAGRPDGGLLSRTLTLAGPSLGILRAPQAWPREAVPGLGRAQRKEPLTQSYRKSGRRGGRGQPTARLPGGVAPGWGLGLGEDVTARPGSFGKVLIKIHTQSQVLALLGDGSPAAAAGLGRGPAERRLLPSTGQ